METVNSNVIYVELDALLDTRIGTLYRLNPTNAEALLKTPAYGNRLEDVFAGFDTAEFQDLYRNRDVETLFNSMMSGMIAFIQEILLKVSKSSGSTPYRTHSTVAINTWPYVLDDAGRAEFTEAMVEYFGLLAEIELVSLTPIQLAPKYCADRFSAMIMYDYDAWMSAHAEEFANTRIPDVTLFAPALFFKPKPTDDQLANIMQTGHHPFKAMMLLAGPIVNLKLVDVSLFSIVGCTDAA